MSNGRGRLFNCILFRCLPLCELFSQDEVIWHDISVRLLGQFAVNSWRCVRRLLEWSRADFTVFSYLLKRKKEEPKKKYEQWSFGSVFTRSFTLHKYYCLTFKKKKCWWNFCVLFLWWSPSLPPGRGSSECKLSWVTVEFRHQNLGSYPWWWSWVLWYHHSAWRIWFAVEAAKMERRCDREWENERENGKQLPLWPSTQRLSNKIKLKHWLISTQLRVNCHGKTRGVKMSFAGWSSRHIECPALSMLSNCRKYKKHAQAKTCLDVCGCIMCS